jgi:PAS domain S-box-containing protein
MRSDLWQPVAIVTALLALLTIFFIQSRSADLAVYERMHEALSNYATYDAELTRDLLSARAGLLANYDPVATDRKHLQGTMEKLRQHATAGSVEAGTGLKQPIDRLEQAQQQKLVDVEHFKAANALLRNSLMYLTFAGSLLHLPDKDKTIAGESTRLSYAVLRYMQAPDADIAAEIGTVLDRLAAVPGMHDDLSTLVAHGRLIVKLAPQADALMRQIVTAPTGVRAQELQATVLQQTDRVEARAQIFRVLLYAVALLLLSYVTYQFVRLKSGARALRLANISLQQEIEARSRATLALRASEERFRAISESAKEAIVSIDARGRIASWNAGAAAMFGYPEPEILGRRFTQLCPVKFRRAHEQAFADLRESDDVLTDIATREFAGVRKNGNEFPLEGSLSTWATEEGRFVTAIMRDISERRRLEETARQQELQLIQTNRMAVLGLLISGVAHEINNPNQLILVNSSVVAETCEELMRLLDARLDQQHGITLGGLPYAEMREQMPLLARDIRDAAIRIRNTVDELKDFFRPNFGNAAQNFELNDSVQRAVRLLNHLIHSKTVHFRTELGEQLPAARGVAQHVEQVVVNLLVNALEALPNNSCGIIVSTACDAERKRLILIVEDQGVGISPADLARLCDPFFTTKQATGGTGLGLAITSTLLHSIGGTLRYESELGKGTRAVVELVCAGDVSVTDNRICNP